MMSDPLVAALLGQSSAALAEDVSLATPVTAPRISGRGSVSAALRAYGHALGGPEATARLKGDEIEGVVYSSGADDGATQIVALAQFDPAGLISTVDVYGRPWPYIGRLMERMAKTAPE